MSENESVNDDVGPVNASGGPCHDLVHVHVNDCGDEVEVIQVCGLVHALFRACGSDGGEIGAAARAR